MQVLCLYEPRKSKPRVKSVLRKQQLTVTFFDCSHLAHIKVIWQIQNFICYCTVIALFYFVFEGNFQIQAPGGLYSEGRFNGGFFCVTSLRAYISRGLFSKFYGIYLLSTYLKKRKNNYLCFNGTMLKPIQNARGIKKFL